MNKRLLCILLCLFALCACARAMDDEEDWFSQRIIEPRVSIVSPRPAQTYEAGGKLTVKATGSDISRLIAVVTFGDTTLTHETDGGALEHVFDVGKLTGAATVTVTGVGGRDMYGREMTDTRTVTIRTPREQLFADMFDEAYRNQFQSKYKFARAQDDYDLGVCKNFVMRLFDTYKDAYRMLAYPDLALHMPKNNSKVNCAPYDYGVEWRKETAEDGSPFEIAAIFRYDKSLTKEENRANCRAVLESVQTGDFFQMAGNYYYGNGPHSLLFIADYDKQTDELHWTDSNMKGESVNGARWGYLQYDAVRTAEWFVDAICTRNRGCTLYRVRDDLYVR